MSIVSLVIAPTLAQIEGKGHDAQIKHTATTVNVDVKTDAGTEPLTPFVEALTKDALVNENEGYSIVVAGDSLVINGKTQSKETFDKYRPLLNGKTELKFEVKKTLTP